MNKSNSITRIRFCDMNQPHRRRQDHHDDDHRHRWRSAKAKFGARRHQRHRLRRRRQRSRDRNDDGEVGEEALDERLGRRRLESIGVTGIGTAVTPAKLPTMAPAIGTTTHGTSHRSSPANDNPRWRFVFGFLYFIFICGLNVEERT